MEASQLLMAVSAFIPLVFGFVHLVYTFRGSKLLPRDAGLIESMKSVSLIITNETTVWKAWIGFNASHSMALILFGLLYGYFAIVEAGLLFGSALLQIIGFLTLVSFVVLARLYWFRIPLVGVSVSLLCYIAGIALALTK